MINLKQLAPYRVHLIMGTFTIAWFTFATLLNILEGEKILWAFWASIKAVKLMEWVSAICVWATMASLVKQNDKLRAKVQLLESRQ
jgi:hypothetical protein